MKIALDLDGPVYNFDKTAQYMIARHMGYTYREQLAWDHKIYWRGIPEKEWDWLWESEQSESLYRHGHLMRGAIEGVRELAKVGQIVVVTKRPQHAMRATIDFLRYHFDEQPWPFEDIHLIPFESDVPKTSVKADILIDDGLDNVDQWAKAGRLALLFDQPWNQAINMMPGVIRCYEWEGVLGAIRNVS